MVRKAHFEQKLKKLANKKKVLFSISKSTHPKIHKTSNQTVT